MKISSSLYVTGENNSRTDFVVNAYGAIIATDRLIDRSISMYVKPEKPLPLGIKIGQKEIVRILTSSSLDVTGENYSRSDFAVNTCTCISYSLID